MRLLGLLLLTIAVTAVCQTHSSDQAEVSANFIIPNPAPSASLDAWRKEGHRTTISLDVDGVQLRGFRYEGSNPNQPAVLFFNGNGMTIDRSSPLYAELARIGPTVYVYDYRGYGFSTGKPDLATFRTDGLRIFDTLVATIPNHRVVIYGYSMGTTVASYIASQRSITALILAAPIASAAEELPVYGRLIGFDSKYLATHKPSQEAVEIFGEAELIKHSEAPLLVLHGTEDFLIPLNQANEVVAASPSRQKELFEVPAADHNQTVDVPDALRAFRRFMEKLPSS